MLWDLILWDLMRSYEMLWDLILWNLVRSYEIKSSMSPCNIFTISLAAAPEYKIPCLMGTEVHPVTLFKICWDLVRSCEIMWDLIVRDLVRSYDIIWDLNLWDLMRSYEIINVRSYQIITVHARPMKWNRSQAAKCLLRRNVTDRAHPKRPIKNYLHWLMLIIDCNSSYMCVL